MKFKFRSGRRVNLVFQLQLHRNHEKTGDPNKDCDRLYTAVLRIIGQQEGYHDDIMEFHFSSVQLSVENQDPKLKTSLVQPKHAYCGPIYDWSTKIVNPERYSTDFDRLSDYCKLQQKIFDGISKYFMTPEGYKDWYDKGRCPIYRIIAGLGSMGVAQWYFDREISEYIMLPAGKFKVEDMGT